MKVSVAGRYVIMARKIKEMVNFEQDVIVPDGLNEGETMSLLRNKEKSPLIKALKEKDNQFFRLSKYRLTHFVATLPPDEELDTAESLGLKTPLDKKPSGKVTASNEFDVTDALADKPKKTTTKVADGKKG